MGAGLAPAAGGRGFDATRAAIGTAFRMTVIAAALRLLAAALLGGVAHHADELEDGMRQTLLRLKAAAEGR